MPGTLATPQADGFNSVEDPKIATAIGVLNGLLTGANLLDGAQIAPGTLPSTGLIDNSVTTPKILDANVTTAKLANGAVTSPKFTPTNGLVQASGDLTLTGSFADVAGATVTFTPSVASYALVWATFDLQAVDGVASGSAYVMEAYGTLTVDGVAQTKQAELRNLSQGTSAVDADIRGTVSQVYRVALDTTSHTLKLQAKQNLGVSGTCYAVGTQFLYMLVAQ